MDVKSDILGELEFLGGSVVAEFPAPYLPLTNGT